MANQFTLPPMGDITSGTVAKVLVNEGDPVEEETPVLELETDKAVQEVPCTMSGTVGKILVKSGDQIEVGTPIFEISGGDSNGAPAEEKAPEKVEASAKTEEPKAAAPAASTSSSTLNGEATKAPSAPQLAEVAQTGLIPAAPSVRRIAREMDVNIRQVTGSGPDGRISVGDIEMFKTGGTPQAAPAGVGVGGLLPLTLPDFAEFGQIERQPLSGIGRATSEQMQRAWNHVPHVTQFDKVDITEIEKLRKANAKLAEDAGGKLTITAIMLKVLVGALKKFPNFNASIDTQSNEIILKKYFHLGVAVDTPHGLLVPVIRDVDRKSIIELSVELGEIAGLARERKLGREQMSGGTFTLTNLGGIGGTQFTPIVNVPEVAILGLSRGVMEPVWNKDSETFEPRLLMPISLSYDHRVINGADGARFTRFIAQSLENPFLMALY